MEKVAQLASDNGVLIFSKTTCCLCYTVEILFKDLGTNPLIYELDQNSDGKEVEKALMKRMGCSSSVPVVFIGGMLVGSANEVMSLHLSGSLISLLKPYKGRNC